METTAKGTDFTIVKEAFERHYSCLGLKCKEIGGYWDNHGYYEGADPCTFDEVQPERVPRKAIGWYVGVPLVVIAVGIFCMWLRNAEKKLRSIDDMSDSSWEEDEDDSPII